jgi:hypothetical protein
LIGSPDIFDGLPRFFSTNLSPVQCQFSDAVSASRVEEEAAMAKTSAKVAGCAVAAMVMLASEAIADPDVPTFVVHVSDYLNLSLVAISKAQAEVAAVYATAGVRIVWTDGAAKLAAADGRKHVDLVIVTREMADRTEPDRTVLGRGSHRTRRAVIYHSRIVEQSVRTGKIGRRACWRTSSRTSSGTCSFRNTATLRAV